MIFGENMSFRDAIILSLMSLSLAGCMSKSSIDAKKTGMVSAKTANSKDSGTYLTDKDILAMRLPLQCLKRIFRLH